MRFPGSHRVLAIGRKQFPAACDRSGHIRITNLPAIASLEHLPQEHVLPRRVHGTAVAKRQPVDVGAEEVVIVAEVTVTPPMGVLSRRVQHGLYRRGQESERQGLRPREVGRLVDEMHPQNDVSVFAQDFQVRRCRVPAPAFVVFRKPAESAHGTAQEHVGTEVLDVVVASQLPRVPNHAVALRNLLGHRRGCDRNWHESSWPRHRGRGFPGSTPRWACRRWAGGSGLRAGCRHSPTCRGTMLGMRPRRVVLRCGLHAVGRKPPSVLSAFTGRSAPATFTR